jgi:hypothetical protein
MPFSFPASPSVGATSVQNGRTYIYAGNNTWELAASASLPSTITGSLAVSGDSSYASTTLLLNGNALKDSSQYARTVTAYGGATASGLAKFGSASLSATSAGQYFEVPSSNDLTFGTGDFTVEAWVRPTGYPVDNAGSVTSAVLSRQVAGDHCWVLYMNGTTSSLTGITFVGWTDNASGNYNVNVNYSFSLNTWYHIAVSRVSGVLYLFINGVLQNSGGTAYAHNIKTSNTPLKIGTLNFDSVYLYKFYGLIADARVTKGVGRYNATFTAPTAELPAYAPYTLPSVTINGSGSGSGGSGSSGLTWSSVPASATASGTAGQIAYDGSYFYLASASNTWVRAALSTWSPFTPTSVTGLAAWWDASDVSTLYDATSGGSLVAVDGAVARWNDKSGNARHATQATSGNRPLRKAAVQNGLGVLRFDGTDFLESSDFGDLTSGASLTIFAVIKRGDSTLNQTILSKYGKSNVDDGNTADGWLWRCKNTSLDGMLFGGTTDESGGASNSTASSGASLDSFAVFSVRASAGAISAASMTRNNSALTSSATATAAETLTDNSYAVTIGALRYSFNYSANQFLQLFNGDIAELVVYTAALSNNDRTAVNQYLMTKWGIS